MPFQGFRGFGAAARPVSEFPPLPPEEEESLLRRIMGTGMGGLQWAGQSLDKLGASVRGVLGGRPDQLLNLIPFSDTLGITDPSERIYGRDLLEQAGVLESNTPGLDFGDVAGFAVDVATDPLSWINPLGALSKGGHVARTAGILDNLPGLAKQKHLATGTGSLSKRGMRSEQTLGELLGYAKANAADDVARQQIDEAVTGAASKLGYDLPDLLNQRLGGGFGFSSGPLGKSIALGGEARPVGKYGEVMDKIGQFAAYNPVSRIGSAGFSRAVRNQTDPILQQELRAFDPLKQAIEPQEILRANKFRDDIAGAYKASGIDPNDTNAAMAFKAYREGQLEKFPELEKFIPPEVRKVADEVGERIENVRTEQEMIGWKSDTKRLQSKYGVKYDPRFADDGKPLDLAREDFLDVPGGTVQIERLLQDGRLAPHKVLTKSEKSRAREIFLGKGFTLDELEQASDLAKAVRNKTTKLSNMSRHERNLYKARQKALREARSQKDPFKGKTARHKIIFQTVFGMTDQQFRNAQIIYRDIKQGYHPVTKERFLDPRKIKNDPNWNPEFLKVIEGQRDLLNKFDHAKELTSWVQSRGYKNRGKLLFPQHSIQDARTYNIAQRGQVEFAKASQDILARHAKTLPDLGVDPKVYKDAKAFSQLDPAKAKLDDYYSIGTALKELGFEDATKGLDYFAQKTGGRFGKTAEHVDAYVPKKVVDNLAKEFKKGKYKTPFDDPKEVNVALDWFDRWVTNFFKLGVTFTPAFHIRNQITGVVQNVLSGAYGFGKVKKYAGAAYNFSKGGTIDGLSKFEGIKRVFGENITDKEATQKLLEVVDAYDLRGSRFDEVVESVEGRADIPEGPFQKLSPNLRAKPGAYNVGYTTPIMTLASGFEGRSLGPLKIPVPKLSAINPAEAAGIGKGVVPLGAPPKVGETIERNVMSKAQREAGRVVEDVNRVSALLGYLDKGYDLASAIKRVKAIHVDYKNLSKTERSVVRRIFPFYSFFRGISENTAKELMEHPGGKLAQTIRASNSGREGGGYVPDYIGEGAAIPLGPDKYLSRLGLMHEGAFDPFVFKTLPGDEEGEAASLDVFRTPGRTMQKFLSMTNPAIKTPLELAFDKNLFTGRAHKDLYPYPIPGGLMRGDFATMGNALINASPASRGFRTVRKLTDERKNIPERVLSGLGGIGLTDVYRGATEAKELDARRLTEELLGESRNIGELTKQYAFKGSTLTPTEKSLLRLSRTFDKRARERAKEIAAH